MSLTVTRSQGLKKTTKKGPNFLVFSKVIMAFYGLSILLHFTAFGLMRTSEHRLPAIVHDSTGGETFSMNRRYNKALMSDSACPAILLVLILAVVVGTQKYSVGKAFLRFNNKF